MKRTQHGGVHFKEFSLLAMVVIGKSRAQLTIRVEIEFAALKIRNFFVNSADLLLSH